MARSALERRKTRNRVYMMVAGLLILVVGVVAIAGFYTVGTTQIDQNVYTSPAKTLAHLVKAQDRFRLQDLDQNGVHDFASSLEALEEAQQITSRLLGSEVRGYTYRILAADEQNFSITASPSDPDKLSYFVDQSRVVRASTSADGPASPDSAIFWHPVHGQLWELPPDTESP